MCAILNQIAGRRQTASLFMPQFGARQPLRSTASGRDESRDEK